MGNKNCGEQDGDYLENQAYGEYQIVQDDGIQYAKVVKIIQSKSGYEKAIEASLVKRKQMKSEGLCEMHYFELQSRESIIQIVFKYQYIPCSLFQKRQLLFSRKQYFSSEQLMKIIDTVSKALQDLYSMKIKHGCINLNTVLCTENGYKITDVSTTTNLNSMQLVQRGYMNQPISKKLVNLINQSQRNPSVIKMLITLEDDLFSLGIIILSLAARAQVSQFYHFIKRQQKMLIQFKDQLVDDYLYLLRMRYNKKLQNIVRKCLFPARQYQQHSFSKASGYRDKNLSETHPNSYFSINVEEQF